MTERTERFPSASFTNLYTILKVRSRRWKRWHI